ncbi:MAG: glycolate oxidase [Firmicutes bacterium HGW-Firmicutes-15]|nr:MAG: glycolate oxidase [Firmicutes bacterium HGW-Firmicutes-15]
MQFKDLPPVKEQLMKCVRCGKCRSVCPVFAEIRNETAAPRGHVFMVEMLRDGKVEASQQVYDRLSNCLMCETCSVNCPSGIDIHELNAAARSYVYKNNTSLAKDMIFDTMWTNPGLLKTAIKMMWGAQKTGMQSLARSLGITKLLPGDMPKAEQILTSIPSRSAKSQLAEINRARGEKKYTVGYFLGCATNLLNPKVAVATVDVLTRNGCEVIIPEGIKCCGLPQLANGKMDTAQQLAAHNVKVFNAYNFDYIVTDCASCSSALASKNMHFLLGGSEFENEAKNFSAKVIDLTSFLIDILDVKPPANEKTNKIKITYHDPCHLANAQGIKAAPRELLQRIPGVELVEMKDANRCCGGSGTYSLTHYDLSMQILDQKMHNAKQTGASKIATCCPSCMMQLRHGINREHWNAEVVHPVELLSDSYKKV